MKRKLKVGDRGRAFGSSRAAVHIFDGEKVTITEIESNLVWILVVIDNDSQTRYTIHRCQFVPLKPKKKPREFWVNVYSTGVLCVHTSEAEARLGTNRLECIHLKEVIGK